MYNKCKVKKGFESLYNTRLNLYLQWLSCIYMLNYEWMKHFALWLRRTPSQYYDRLYTEYTLTTIREIKYWGRVMLQAESVIFMNNANGGDIRLGWYNRVGYFKVTGVFLISRIFATTTKAICAEDRAHISILHIHVSTNSVMDPLS